MAFKVAPGSGATGLSIVGGGLALAFPDQRWIGFLLIGIGALVFLFDVRFERGQVRLDGERVSKLVHWHPPRKRLGMLGLCLVAVAVAGAYWWNANLPPEERLLSTWGTQIYSCDRTRLDPKFDHSLDLATRRARAAILENALGVHIEIDEIPGGLRFTFIPITENAKRAFGELPAIRLEEQAVGNILIVKWFVTIPIYKMLFDLIPAQGKYKTIVEKPRMIEQYLGFLEGACRMI